MRHIFAAATLALAGTLACASDVEVVPDYNLEGWWSGSAGAYHVGITLYEEVEIAVGHGRITTPDWSDAAMVTGEYDHPAVRFRMRWGVLQEGSDSLDFEGTVDEHVGAMTGTVTVTTVPELAGVRLVLLRQGGGQWSVTGPLHEP